jgi:hypothetical protein
VQRALAGLLLDGGFVHPEFLINYNSNTRNGLLILCAS